MFGIDFYPTPQSVIDKMLEHTSVQNKVVLEPSAGKGNIVDRIVSLGAKEVLSCEIDVNLRKILQNKSRVIETDFLSLTAEVISHIDLIVMNPPFSQQEAHIMKAWEIAPEGCEIISLCNDSLMSNGYSKSREIIKEIVSNNGNYEALGKVFSTAERETDVYVGCLRLFKPKTGADEFDCYFDMHEAEDYGNLDGGLMSPNYIKDIVSRYVDAVKMFDDVVSVSSQMNKLIDPIDGFMNISFGAFRTDRDGDRSSITKEAFRKELQKSAWKTVFSIFKMQKYVTKGVLSDINKFVENHTQVPFTASNIYKVVEMIIGTSEDRMGKVLVEAFEKICSYSYDNSSAGEKWKTNSENMVNRRFIKPYVCEYDSRWPKEYVDIRSSGGDSLEDIVKALCFITGKDFDSFYIPISSFFRYKYKLMKEDGTLLGGYENCFNDITGYRGAASMMDKLAEKGIKVEIVETERNWGQWVEWGFFRVRAYKKGTMHFEFLDENVWHAFNQKVAEYKGWQLPKKTKKTYRAKTEGVTLFD